MSLTVVGKARLVTDAKRGRTGAGKPWCNAVLRVVNYRKTDAGWEEHSSFSCTAVAFEDVAFKLAGFAKGDEVEFTGRVRELKVWTPDRGEPRAQLGLSLDEVTAPVKRPRDERVSGDAIQNRTARVEPRSRERVGAASQPSSGRPEEGSGSGRTPRQSGPSQKEPWPAVAQPARSDQSPTDLAEFRREAGTRLLRQHTGNAHRAGRLA